jgi:hypothetical protein
VSESSRLVWSLAVAIGDTSCCTRRLEQAVGCSSSAAGHVPYVCLARL